MSVYNLLNALTSPSPVTSLASNSISVAAGSADGSVRFYDLPHTKVHKAIRGLPDEIASLAFEIGEERRRYIWAASGKQIFQFDTQVEKIILQTSDSSKVLVICNSEEDVVNKIDVNKTHLAFSSDTGAVGVIDLTSYSISFMSNKHGQLCDAISFIPGFSRELISGGFDYRLMHHHYLYKSLLSQHDITKTIPPETSEDHIALAPPFIHCMSISETGLLATGTADGRLVMGIGASTASKKQRKWEGLRSDGLFAIKAADGPIVGIEWITDSSLILVTLSGTLKIYEISSQQLEAVELTPSSSLFKVNATTRHGDQLVVAGLDAAGKGIVNIIMHYAKE